MSNGTRSPQEIENDIAKSRTRLAATVDELAYRAKPKTIATRQMESAKKSIRDATFHENGDLKIEVVGPIALVVVGLVAIAIVRRARS